MCRAGYAALTSMGAAAAAARAALLVRRVDDEAAPEWPLVDEVDRRVVEQRRAGRVDDDADAVALEDAVGGAGLVDAHAVADVAAAAGALDEEAQPRVRPALLREDPLQLLAGLRRDRDHDGAPFLAHRSGPACPRPHHS